MPSPVRGPDIQSAGNRASQILYEAMKQSWNNRPGFITSPDGSPEHFRGTWGFDLGMITPKVIMYQSCDGIGTKVEIAQRVGDYRTIAHCLLAMVLDDLARDGIEPFTLATVLDVSRLDDSHIRFIEELAEGYLAAAHITGGGLPEKVASALNGTGKGCRIDNPFPPSDLMLHCQELGKMKDYEAYKTWCMGTGFVVATDDPDTVIQIAKAMGYTARAIGTVVDEPGITIHSNGVEGQSTDKEEYLYYPI